MTAPALLDASGQVIPPGVGTMVRMQAAMTAYVGADRRSQELAAWAPALASGDLELAYERDTIVARSRDLVRNDGAAKSALQSRADLLVGNSFVLQAKPDATALGIAPEEARKLGKQIEAEFRQWAEDPLKRCDSRRRFNFSGLLQLMAKVQAQDGEAFGVLGFRKTGGRYRTTLDVIDSDRVSNPVGQIDASGLRRGIEMDRYGAPIAYHVRRRPPLDLGFTPDAWTWDRVPRETGWGRPVVVHWFEPDRAEMSRGVPDFAPVLQRFKQLSRYADAELSNAVVNAMFGAFVTSGLDPSTIAASLGGGEEDPENVAASWQEMRMALHGKAPLSLNGIRLPILPPGDKVELNTSPRQTTGYAQFQTAFLQTIAASLGLSYEQVSMDWSRTNYSSARAALNEVWRWVQARRFGLISTVVAPVYLAVLEEMIDNGYIDVPPGAVDFYEAPAAWARAIWVGPARGYVDPEKEAGAAQKRMDYSISTLERECADQGMDWEQVIQQRQEEREALLAAGLPVQPLDNPTKPYPDTPLHDPLTQPQIDQRPPA